jgi:PAS domain S-box-containing protein
MGIFLIVSAVLAAATYLLLPWGSHRQAVATDALVATTCLIAGVTVALIVARGGWRGVIWLAWGLLLVGAMYALLFLAEILRPSGSVPAAAGALFMLVLFPLVELAVAEYREHFDPEERRELGVDALLIASSLTAILYVLIRPAGADMQISLTAAIFAILAATQLSVYTVPVLWLPNRAHVAQALTFTALGVATAALGWQWCRGTRTGPIGWEDLIFVLAPLVLAGIVVRQPEHAGTRTIAQASRWARPALTSIAVVAACSALALVAILDDGRGLSNGQSALMIGLLGLAVAARIVANQISSTQAQRQVRQALVDKEAALTEADHALERVRQTNETLRDSEEHLRLVFDTAVDGVVELDADGVVLRTNGAFAEMVALDRTAIEGQRWTALAAAVTGASADVATLPGAGEAEIRRPDGQVLHLESRVSQLPTAPPRTLMLVRDVTAARVADQTIRSLFQFLQDRDEDRSRLLRRTNAAIEAERNRIARDLHDGPVQGVSAASLSLEAALLMIKAGDVEHGIEVLGKIREELTAEADGLRHLMSGLRPPVLEERGLVPALREMVARFGDEQGVHAEFVGRLAMPLPEDLETLAYRVVQESLSNAAKHAGASMLTVLVESDGTQLRIEVQDDGSGFDAAMAREYLREGRVGLASMRERVELASGTFVVRSSPQRGTTIMATLPVEVAPIERELAVNDV